nr:homogentisate phytyltransferase 1, chloroplastic-like isoform X1 [Ipomoea batatas]
MESSLIVKTPIGFPVTAKKSSFPSKFKIFYRDRKSWHGEEKQCVAPLRLRRPPQQRFTTTVNKHVGSIVVKNNNVSSANVVPEYDSHSSNNNIWESFRRNLDVFCRFARVHVILGVVSVAAAFMSLFISGVNHLCDIEIDKVNKPQHPIASGEYSVKTGVLIVVSVALMDTSDVAGDELAGIQSLAILWGEKRITSHAAMALILWNRVRSFDYSGPAAYKSFYLFLWKVNGQHYFACWYSLRTLVPQLVQDLKNEASGVPLTDKHLILPGCVQEYNGVLTVQTLRNNIMASTLLASTAIMLSSLIAVLMTGGAGASGDRSNALVFGDKSDLGSSIKFFSILVCFLVAFLFNIQSIRYYSHASILVNVPYRKIMATSEEDPKRRYRCVVTSEEYVGMTVNRGSYFWSLGLRAFYFSFPLFLWIFGPIPMFLCCVVLVFMLYFLDFTMDFGLLALPTNAEDECNGDVDI